MINHLFPPRHTHTGTGARDFCQRLFAKGHQPDASAFGRKRRGEEDEKRVLLPVIEHSPGACPQTTTMSSSTPPPPATGAATTSSSSNSGSSTPPLLRRIASFTRRRSRDGSLDLSAALPVLEHRLTEKTDLIDDLKKIVPLDVEAPGIIALGCQGSGKSTVLEAITGVPIPRTHAATPQAGAAGGGYGPPRRVLRIKINADPTVSK